MHFLTRLSRLTECVWTPDKKSGTYILLADRRTESESLIMRCVSDDQGVRSVERRREFQPQRGGAGPDEGGGSEDEQCAAHHVAGSTERMVSVTPRGGYALHPN